MLKQSLISLSVFCLTAAGTTSVYAADYECYRAAKPSGWVKNRHPKGNWGPQHDTRKWTYASVVGADIYRHRNGKRTVGTRCKGLGYDYGTLKIDFVGTQDWCVNYQNGWAAASSSPSCTSGYTLSADKKTCTKPGSSAYWKKNRKPKGNWGPQHDTRKWSYAAISGGDIYRHRNGKRTVGTRCKGIGYNYGVLKIDFEGKQDWCATHIPAVAPRMVAAQCPANSTLRPKQITNSGTTVLKAVNKMQIQPQTKNIEQQRMKVGQ